MMYPIRSPTLCSKSRMMSLTTSPIEITPTTLPASSTGKWRKPRAAIIAIQPSSRSSGLTVTGLPVITWPTGVCFASSPGSSTLMAQSPWVTIPTSMSSSMTSTDRTRLSRIWSKASTTISPERTRIRAPFLWASAFFTVLIDLPVEDALIMSRCAASGARDSQHLEDRQRQYGLRKEADGEGKCAKHRQAERIDDQVRNACPEVDGAGKRSPFRGVIQLRQDQHQRREDDEILDRVVVREHQPIRPFGVRLVVARGIGHRAGEAANLDATEDVGDPQDSSENHRARQPEQFARHRFPLISIFEARPAGCLVIAECLALRYARTRT